MLTDPLYPDRSLSEFFERSVRAFGDRVALASDTAELTFAELNSLANRLACRLRGAGGSRGDRVAVLMTQDLPSFASMLGILKAGRVVMVLNPVDPPARLRELIGDAEPTAILADCDHRDLALALARSGVAVVTVDEGLSGPPLENPGGEAERGDLAMLIYTSGTTGRPKAVMQSHGHIMRNAIANIRRMTITPEDRIILVASLWGGQGNNTTWTAFASGARLVSYPANVNGVTGLAERMDRHHVTIYASASSLFRHFMKSVAGTSQFPAVRYVKLSSDAATSDDFAAFKRHFPNATLVSTAGMSEAGNIGWLALSRNDKVADGRLPIGHASEGLSIRLVDESGRDVPQGSVGTLVLAARHMALGYWRDPELTARHFSVAADGTQVFHSADLGQVDERGRLFLAGRKDVTFKIRGQRVDLSEVERGLSTLPGIGAVAAGAVPRPNGELQLVAYIVPLAGEIPTAGKLRMFARAVMPRHLVPSAFIFLDRMPLAANGKVDRTRLRAMAPPPRDQAIESPIGATEVMLACIWEEAFDLPAIGRSDDFFDLGGDSLIAAVIAARVHAMRNVELNFGSFVDHPRLSAMATAIEEGQVSAQGRDEVPLAATDRSRPLPLSLLQTFFWRAGSAPHKTVLYTRALCARIDGPLDLGIFRASIGDVVRRHEILRTRFVTIDGAPMQIVQAPAPVDLPLLDYSPHLDAEERVTALLEEESRRVFDLAAGPPLSLRLSRTAPGVHWLVKSTHHIITDAFSWNVFFADLAKAYELRAAGDQAGLPPLPIQYGDLSVWQRQVFRRGGPKLESLLDWWERQFQSNPIPTALPLRLRRPAHAASEKDGTVQWGLTPATSKRIDDIGHAAGATFYMVRLAGVVPVLAALTGRDDALVGGIFTNRNRLVFESMFGPFANLVMIGMRCNWDWTYREFVARARDHVIALQTNAEIPQGQLLEEMAVRGISLPSPAVMVHVRTPYRPLHFAGLGLSVKSADGPMRGITIGFNQFREADDCYVAFDARLYERETVNVLHAALARFFDAAAGDPDVPLGVLVERSEIEPMRGRPAPVSRQQLPNADRSGLRESGRLP